MSYLQVNTGSKAAVDFYTGVGGFSLTGALMKLFTNNHTPDILDTPAAYTEAGFPGYAPVALSGFTAAVINGLNQAQTQAAVASFLNTSGSPVNVYGYFITDPTGVVLHGAELFVGGPISIAAGFGLGIPWFYTDIHA